LVEKIILLEDIALTDFLGIENVNIKEVAQAFPQSKIIARGNEIRLKGSTPEIMKLNELFEALLAHYQKFSRLNPEDVKAYLQKNAEEVLNSDNGDMIVYGIKGTPIKARTPNQQKMVEALAQNDMVFAIGPAGTGKTYMAVALAVRALKNKEVRKIVITRPAVEAGESLGFLPGDLKEKIDPYLRPIYDALDDMIPSEKLKYYQEKNIIEIAPLAYMRGRTLNDAFVLLDEAENTTAMQMEMTLTRLGIKSKMIITGDGSQVDLPRNQKSGLADAVQILQNIKGISIIKLSEEDVVRHRLVRQIIGAYEKFESKPSH